MEWCFVAHAENSNIRREIWTTGFIVYTVISAIGIRYKKAPRSLGIPVISASVTHTKLLRAICSYISYVAHEYLQPNEISGQSNVYVCDADMLIILIVCIMIIPDCFPVILISDRITNLTLGYAVIYDQTKPISYTIIELNTNTEFTLTYRCTAHATLKHTHRD